MNPEIQDLKGRVIVQSFVDELEKIALSPETMARALAKRRAQATAQKAQLGWRTWLPGSREAAASRMISGKASGMQKQVNEALLRKRKDALALMASPREADRAAGSAMLKRLKAVKAPEGRLDAARRRFGMGQQVTPPPEPSLLQRPGVRMAGAAGALGLGGAGGAYLLKRHMDRQQGYGGY